jgi:hypothetical protein
LITASEFACKSPPELTPVAETCARLRRYRNDLKSHLRQQCLPPDSMFVAYSGDGNHASSSSVVAVTLTGVLAIGFTLDNSGNITIASGSSTGTSTIAVTPAGGFAGQVNLACAIPSTPGNSTGVLAPISCDIPLQVVISSASTVTLQGSSAAAEVPCRIKEAAAPLPVLTL